MKVLLLLFLVSITYSYSIEVKFVPIDNSMTTLNSAANDGYFYFSIGSYTSNKYLYLYLLDIGYLLNNPISYCLTNTNPSQAINNCNFITKYYDDKDYSGESKGYFYRISLDNSIYLIIKYSGCSEDRTIKARGSFSNLIEKIPINTSSDKSLTKFDNINNYFYVNIEHDKHDYLYLYFNDPNSNVFNVHYCRTNSNPQYSNNIIRDCYFYPLDMDEIHPNNGFSYSYKLKISSYSENYIIVKYSVYSSNKSLSVKGLYMPSDTSSKPLSANAVVFITIVALAFIDILIIIYYYYCRNNCSNNIDIPDQPATILPPQPALVGQTPASPLVE